MKIIKKKNRIELFFTVLFFVLILGSGLLIHKTLNGWVEGNRAHVREDTINLGKVYAMQMNTELLEGKLFIEIDVAEYLREIEKNNSADYAYVLDADQNIISSKQHDEPIHIRINQSIIDNLNEDEEASTLPSQGDNRITTYIPIYNEEVREGTLILTKEGSLFIGIEQSIILGIITVLSFIIIGLIIYGRWMYIESKNNLKRAYYDPLTNLPNDTSMKEYLKDRIAAKKPQQEGLFLVEIQNFRTLNMALGFEIGDQIIKEVANRLKSALKNQGSLFRFTGGRFIFHLKGYKNQQRLLEICEDIMDTFEEPFSYLSRNKQIQPKIGIVEMDGQYLSVDSVIKDATITLSHITKNTPRYLIFSQEMRTQIDRAEIIELELIRILSEKHKKNLSIVYQPKINLKTNEIMGFEALARVTSNKLGGISPGEFIQVAEEKQLIIPLGSLILEIACEFLNELIELGYKNLKMGVNVSGTQILAGNFIQTVTEIIEKTKISPKNLELEITETVLLENYEKINGELQKLRDLGIEISMDDFGTGFSSLASIGELNIDTVKIDQHFIKQIILGNEENIITKDIITMAHKIGLNVVAEGIETKIQKKYLVDHGCDIMQGFHFSQPLSEEKAKKILLKNQDNKQ